MAARSTLGFLHLTGLRLGTPDQNWHPSRVKGLLLADLERLHAEVGPLDLVLLAGELTRTGAVAEFDEVDRLLDRLFECLIRLGSAPTLVAVPGMHDMVAATSFDPIARDLRHWHDDDQLRDHVLAPLDNLYMSRLRVAFAHYTAWDDRGHWRHTSRGTGLLPGDSATTLVIGGREIGVVGLNSAHCAFAGVEMDINPQQLHMVCGHDAPEWLGRHDLNLLLTRHPPSALPQRARADFDAEVDVPGRFAAHLCGDGDSEVPLELTQGGAPARRLLPGVPLCPDRGSCGYNAGRISWNDAGVDLSFFPRRVHRHRIDRAQDSDLDDRGALHFCLPTRNPGRIPASSPCQLRLSPACDPT